MRNAVSTTIAQMTKEELQEMLEATIEQKLLEMLGDPDEGLELRDGIRERLLRQQKTVSEGERGQSFDDLAQRLELG